MEWYKIDQIGDLNSPGLLLYKNRMEVNIAEMLNMVEGQTERLMPHVKTNKCQQVIASMVKQGITKFKASTMAEAALAAQSEAEYVLIAHQAVGPKINELFEFQLAYRKTKLATLIDNLEMAQLLDHRAGVREQKLRVYIDVNNGMDRSGIKPGEGLSQLLESMRNFEHLIFMGLHIYDGHLRDSDLRIRTENVQAGIAIVEPYITAMREAYPETEVVAGGTPTFSVHRHRQDFVCSPGTCVFQDWGYAEKLPEQKFQPAVLILARIISKPTEGIVTIDLGHKAVAAENPVERRFKILNLSGYALLSQSEEHGVLQVENWEELQVGDALYALPYHICPSVNLHSEIAVIEDNEHVANWPTIAAIR
ncbi:alanine racemase [Marinilongibacter aquaticus]|uniref:alanine racemase n=1 Tax=Marinilongibacter aquaticus TaxID=2975157 RepID=UPI0021BDCE97|nr:alanine racemase [Marinilongibacter aquaticus]UBM60439.1 alanine racemase [Marinilongibacter aquaticus]